MNKNRTRGEQEPDPAVASARAQQALRIHQALWAILWADAADQVSPAVLDGLPPPLDGAAAVLRWELAGLIGDPERGRMQDEIVAQWPALAWRVQGDGHGWLDDLAERIGTPAQAAAR